MLPSRRRAKPLRGMIPLELLLSVCLIGGLLLLATILIEKSLAVQRSRDLLRFNQVQVILGSILEYQIDHAGALPAQVMSGAGMAQMIALPGEVCTNVCENHPVRAECLDLSALVPAYLDAIPQDPFFTKLGPSGYYIHREHDQGVLTVGACESETHAVIESSR